MFPLKLSPQIRLGPLQAIPKVLYTMAAVVAISAAATGRSPELQFLVLSDHLTDHNGQSWKNADFGAASLNNLGDATFLIRENPFSPIAALWAHRDGKNQKIIQVGDPAPQGGGSVLGDFFYHLIDDSRHVWLPIRSSESPLLGGLWQESAGKFHLVVGAGTELPGVVPAIALTTPLFSTVPSNGTLIVGDGALNPNRYWVGNSEGGFRPVLSEPQLELIPEVSNLVTNGQRDVAFVGVLLPPQLGIWAGPAGNSVPIVLQGDPSPGVPGQSLVQPLKPQLNEAGDVLFASTINRFGYEGQFDMGLWLRRGSENHLVVVTSQPTEVNGASLEFKRVQLPLLLDQGDVIFSALFDNLNESTQNQTGIFSGNATGIRPLVQTGQQVPGRDPGIVFRRIEDELAVSPFGSAAFVAEVGRLGVDGVGERGLWVAGPAGIAPVLSIGQTITTSVGDARQVAEFRYFANAGTWGILTPMQAFNDLNQLGLTVKFVDGTSAVVIADISVPEPSTCPTALIVVALWFRQRRRSLANLSAYAARLSPKVSRWS